MAKQEAEEPAKDSQPPATPQLAKPKKQRLEAIPNVWVRFNGGPGQAAGPHIFGPFVSRNSPSRRITLEPGQWTEVDGHWGRALAASKLSHMVDFSEKKPKGV